MFKAPSESERDAGLWLHVDWNWRAEYPHESVAQETNRGHTINAGMNSFHLVKDCGLKVVMQM